jgi:uncharacterized membrane protein (Fun14 family)
MKQIQFELFKLGVEAGSGGILGFLTGYGAKKFTKLVAVIVGLELALIKFLESEGIVMDVQWKIITETVVGMSEIDYVHDYLLDSLIFLPIGGGFATGAAIGFKRG